MNSFEKRYVKKARVGNNSPMFNNLILPCFVIPCELEIRIFRVESFDFGFERILSPHSFECGLICDGLVDGRCWS